jgi:hypothetical protein
MAFQKTLILLPGKSSGISKVRTGVSDGQTFGLEKICAGFVIFTY